MSPLLVETQEAPPVVTTPPERTFTIPAEARVLVIPAENRRLEVTR